MRKLQYNHSSQPLLLPCQLLVAVQMPGGMAKSFSHSHLPMHYSGPGTMAFQGGAAGQGTMAFSRWAVSAMTSSSVSHTVRDHLGSQHGPASNTFLSAMRLVSLSI